MKKELKELNTNQHVPSSADVLENIHARMLANIEMLKRGNEELGRELAEKYQNENK